MLVGRSLCCVFLLFSWQADYVEATLQTLSIDVRLSDALPSQSSYSLLASPSFFGKTPSMDKKEVPRLTLMLPPEENSLLCDNVTNAVSQAQGRAMLVPRGECTFERKALNSQRLGAEAVLIYGNLASRYALNKTNQTGYQYSEHDIIYPTTLADYDCMLGQAMIPSSSIELEPLPYNADHNNPLLSGESAQNLCLVNSRDSLINCASKSCLLTGNSSSDAMEACCAWDVPILLYSDNQVDRNAVSIPTAYLTMLDGSKLLRDMQQNEQVYVVLYNRWRPAYDLSSAAVWMLGVFVAGLASYLTAGDYRQLIKKALQRHDRLANGDESRRSATSAQRSAPTEFAPPAEEVLELTAAHALGFIVMASSSLLILFYFKIYGVVKVFYALGCSTAVSQVVMYPLTGWALKKWNVRDLILWRTNTEDFGDITLRDALSHGMGYSLGLAWLVVAFTVRKPENLAFFWITQDVFGACMCIMFLKVIRLNSIRVAAILLIVAFFYDIFFVFITPYIFKGKSVMITVATSGGPPQADPSWCEKYPNDKKCEGGNPLPMLLAVPRIFDYQDGSSLLGLGDIVLPGLLLSFAARFDAAKSLLGVLGGGNGALNSFSCPEQRFFGKCWLCSGGYFAPLVIAYAVGLLMANMAVVLMQKGQPALLYLVPCCLGTLSYIGWRRKELGDLWEGPRAIRTADNILYADQEHTYEQDQTAINTRHVPLPVEDGQHTPTVPSAEDGE